MDNKVFKLAEQIKQDMLQLNKDYENDNISEEYYCGCMANSQVILDYMADIWDVNLAEYYVDSKY
jgi:hypothetical protein